MYSYLQRVCVQLFSSLHWLPAPLCSKCFFCFLSEFRNLLDVEPEQIWNTERMCSNTTPNYFIPTLVIKESNPPMSIYRLTPACVIS